MSSLEKGDFLVTQIEGKKQLVKVIDPSDKTKIIGLSQRMTRNAEGEYEKRTKVDFKAKEIVVNLGKSPLPGKVYGVNIEPLFRKEDTNICGEILFFVDFDDKQVAKTKNALIKAYKELKAKNLLIFDATVEIRAAEGKYAGWYKHLPKGPLDILCVKPNFDTMKDSDLRYVILHESAHGIWYRGLSKKSIAKWIQMYEKHMALSECDEDALKEFLDEIKDAGSIRDYLKSAEEEQKLSVKAALKHIKAVHSINAQHLDSLLRQNEPIDEYWPSFVEFSEKNFIISEYAATEPEEFFAEAFAYWITGKKLPKDVQKLLDISLSGVTRQSMASKDNDE